MERADAQRTARLLEPHDPLTRDRKVGARRRKDAAWLAATLALTLFVLIQRPFLACLAERLLEPFGPSFDYWGALAWIFFEDRWALTLCVLALVWRAYVLLAPAKLRRKPWRRAIEPRDRGR